MHNITKMLIKNLINRIFILLNYSIINRIYRHNSRPVNIQSAEPLMQLNIEILANEVSGVFRI